MTYAMNRAMLSVDHNAGIEDLLDRWTARGLINAEQADLIRKAESSEPNLVSTALTHVGRRRSLIAEALDYFGGVLIVVAASLITQRYWSDIPTWGRFGVADKRSCPALCCRMGRLPAAVGTD
jgi:hypothetical protein